jgi:Fe-S cluster biogenesis protein NfuA
MNASEIMVDLEFTPNPNTLKYVTSVALLLAGAQNYPTRAQAEGKSELAVALFDLQGIAGVMVGKNFVTVTLNDQDSLTELNEKIISTIKTFLASGRKAVNPEALVSEHGGSVGGSDVESKIIDILDREIRPAVAMDGGDITFEKFQDGIVFLHMKGSCAGCPSSTATLKMGIENRLKEFIPEVTEVVAV